MGEVGHVSRTKTFSLLFSSASENDDVSKFIL